MLSTGNFPDNMKLADTTPVFKKKDPLKKENYIPVSILSAISKILNDPCKRKSWVTWTTFCPLTYVAIEKVLLHSKRR